MPEFISNCLEEIACSLERIELALIAIKGYEGGAAANAMLKAQAAADTAHENTPLICPTTGETSRRAFPRQSARMAREAANNRSGGGI